LSVLFALELDHINVCQVLGTKDRRSGTADPARFLFVDAASPDRSVNPLK